MFRKNKKVTNSCAYVSKWIEFYSEGPAAAGDQEETAVHLNEHQDQRRDPGPQEHAQ